MSGGSGREGGGREEILFFRCVTEKENRGRFWWQRKDSNSLLSPGV